MRRPVERVLDYDGYLLRFPGAAERAVLLLHGFPAHRHTKNLDLAFDLSTKRDHTIYLLHYKGLGESWGDFSFTASIDEATRLVDRLVDQEKHEALTIFGTSWGGLVALNVAHARPEKVRRLVLTSPLLDMKESDPLFPWLVSGVKDDLPGIFGKRTEEEVRADAALVAAKHVPSKIVSTLSPKVEVFIYQAQRDDITPAARARAVVPLFAKAPFYQEVDQDHSFLNREHLFETVARHVD